MRFGFLTGAATGAFGGGTIGFDKTRVNDPTYRRHDLRYKEALDEIVFAEKMGFDVVGMPEQHFAPDVCATSSPEVMYGAIAVLTSRIRIRSMISLPLFPMNHPMRIAEQAATIDILSDGRYEIGTGRSNQALQLDFYGIDLNETRELWDEGVRVIAEALASTPGEFQHEGKHFHLPRRTVVPGPIQRPHPPIFVASSSTQGHHAAGAAQLGVMSFSNYGGFDQLAEFRAAYSDGWGTGERIGHYPLNYMTALAMPSVCLENREEARKVVSSYATTFGGVVDVSYLQLAQRSPDYAYMSDAARGLRDKITDMEYLGEESGSAVIGNPQDCIRQVQKYADLGIDEVIFGIDGMPHNTIMKSLELFGKYVMPHFRGRDETKAISAQRSLSDPIENGS